MSASLRTEGFQEPFSPARNFFARFTAATTFVLIVAGGLVTSTGSSLAVPDWPLSFGQFFPPMVGGVLYEHSHRMVAGTVAILTAVLAIWTWRSEPRRWVRHLTVAALGAVLLQAALGGITVLFLLPPAVSIAHACLAQAFFCLVVIAALVSGRPWIDAGPRRILRRRESIAGLATATTAAVYLQLILGAVMRHSGAGLAIPDFPLAFGRLVPEMTSTAVVIHFAHRMGAAVVAVLVAWTAFRTLVHHREDPALMRPASLLVALVALQVLLGALTIWTHKGVVPTTAHVVTGAAVLATSLVLALRSYRRLEVRGAAEAPAMTPETVPA